MTELNQRSEQNANAVPIQCPNCGTQYSVPVRTMIDVSAEPRLRQQFLANQINVAVCPNCQTGGLLEVPLVYHDAGAEFLRSISRSSSTSARWKSRR